MNLKNVALRYADRLSAPIGSDVLLHACMQTAGRDAAGDWSAQKLAAIGQAVAMQLPVQTHNSLSELEDAMNDCLIALNWGWVQLEERDTCVLIEHSGCPLGSLMNDEGGEHWPNILIGLYEYWFRSAGAPHDLTVQVYAPVNAEDRSVTLSLQ